MSISIRRYVDITSAVGAGFAVRQRDLIGRIFTSNPRVPAGVVLEMTTADDVLQYFGASSQEYLRAVFYFGFVSKSATRAKKISFVFASPNDEPGRIYGGNVTGTPVGTIAGITNGAASVTLQGIAVSLAGVDFTGAASYAAVALILQTAIRAANVAPAFANADVTYDPVSGGFNVVAGDDGAGTTAWNAPTSGTDLGVLLKLNAATRFAISNGSDGQTPVESVSESAVADNNFASFLFIDPLSLDEEEAIGQWLAAQNFMYMYCAGYSDVPSAQAAYAQLGTYPGIAATLSPVAGEFPEVLPMAILAATDFERRAANKNYMFQTASGLTASVTSNATADTLDGVRTNYYGRTQTAGQLIEFYQRGSLFGGPTDATAINVYVNEIWLKDRVSGLLMELLLNLEALPANNTGRGYVLAQIQTAIDQAIRNGVISVGKELTSTQRLYVTEQTGDPLAWLQVQNVGYWINCTVQPEVAQNGETEYVASYLLIYSKGDAIRKIDGSHVLI